MTRLRLLRMCSVATAGIAVAAAVVLVAQLAAGQPPLAVAVAGWDIPAALPVGFTAALLHHASHAAAWRAARTNQTTTTTPTGGPR